MTDVGGLSEQLQNHQCVRTKSNPSDFIKGVKLMVNDSQLYEKISEEMIKAREDLIISFDQKMNSFVKQL